MNIRYDSIGVKLMSNQCIKPSISNKRKLVRYTGTPGVVRSKLSQFLKNLISNKRR